MNNLPGNPACRPGAGGKTPLSKDTPESRPADTGVPAVPPCPR
jgi:hypothetical protein